MRATREADDRFLGFLPVLDQQIETTQVRDSFTSFGLKFTSVCVGGGGYWQKYAVQDPCSVSTSQITIPQEQGSRRLSDRLFLP